MIGMTAVQNKSLFAVPFRGIKLLIYFCLLVLPRLTFGQTNFVILANDGAWTWFNDPRALFHNGTLYFGYDRAADGKTVLSALNLQSGNVTNLWASSYSQTDDHDVPGLLVKDDGTMLAIYSRHQSDQYFFYRLSTSTNPASASDWGAEQTIPATGASMTYANPFQLSSENGRIYDFCRNLNYNPTVLTSANGGATWSSPQILIQTGTGSTRPYVKYCSDYNQRIDFLYTDAHPDNDPTSLYHMYYQNGAFYQTDGTFLKSFSDLPILHDSGERGTVIYQYSEAAQSDPNQWIPTGRAWCWQIGYQTNGYPVCVFQVKVDNVTGSTWSDARIYYYYARWTGTNWQKRFIAHAGRPLYNGQPDYGGGICFDPQNPSTIYISTDAENPFDLSTTTNVPLGANYEIWKGITADGGLTFAWQPMTGNSTVDNLRPYVPRYFGGEPCVLWFRRTYTSYTSFNTEMVGLFTTKVPQTNATSGTWSVDANGLWSDAGNWADGIIADGAGNTADFSTLDLIADRTVTLDTPRAIGTLRFGDLSGDQNWTLNSSNGAVLTLSSGSPSIVVNQNVVTLSMSLAGTNGFTKSGAGTLVLAASNSLSGILNLDSGSTSANDGAVRVTSSAALANVASPINFRNNSGSDAVGSFQLDGSAGGIVVTQNFSTSCRNNNTTPTFENIAGTNSLAGNNFVQVGGTNVIYQSDSNSLLVVTAPIQYVGTLTAARVFTFTGDGDITVSGDILAASNDTTPIGLIKTGNGALTLAGANTYANGTTVSGGTLLVNGTLANGLLKVIAGTLGGTGVIDGATIIQSGATLAPGLPKANGTVGTLIFNSTLTLAAGGAIVMKLNKTFSTNDSVKVNGPLTYDGTLVLTNLSGAMTVGDSFKLFSATSYAGAFSSVSPAAPGVGLLWNTNNLNVDGTLSITLGNVNPQFGSISQFGTNLIFSGSDGAAGARFSVLTSTNLMLPLSNWSIVTTKNFDGAGNFSVTANVQPHMPFQFYEISIP
jgi:autotransporter-associated beta strand protein